MQNTEYISLGFGSNDYIAVIPEIPLDSKVKITKHVIQGGGPAATAAVCAARLGMSAAFCGVVGDDDAGKRIIADLEKEHVYTGNLLVRKNSESPVAYCWVAEETGKRSVAWTRGSAAELRTEEIDSDLIVHAKVLHLDGHNPAAAIQAAKIAKAHGVLVNFDAGTWRDGTEELLKLADILIASEEFACRFAGVSDREEALKKLGSVGAKVTGITMGEAGSMLLDGGKILRCPAFKVDVVDTTGAGDTYHTGFAVRYCDDGDLIESMRFGAAVAALKCRKIGGRAGIPSRPEVEEFLKKH